MTTTTQQSEQMLRMSRARSRMIFNAPFFGTQALNLELVEDKSCRSAWTDGKRLGFSPRYVAQLNDAQLEALIAHEVMHCANGHVWRRPLHRAHESWNEDCDYAINSVIESCGMELPPKVLLDSKYDGLSAEEIAALRQDEEAEEQQPDDEPDTDDDQQDDDGGDDSSPGETDDDSDESDDSDDQTDADDGDDGQDQDEESGDDADDGQGSGDADDGDDTDESSEPGQGSGTGGDADPNEPDLSREHIGEIREPASDEDAKTESEWRTIAVQAAQVAEAAGQMPDGAKLMVEAMKTTTVDWRAVLHQFMQRHAASDYTFQRPNKRYQGTGFIMPSLRSEAMPPVIVGFDTSYSTLQKGTKNHAAVQAFIAEMRAAVEDVRPEKVLVYCCDTEVQEEEPQEFGPEDPFEPELVGGGGTRFAPLLDRADADDDGEACCLIYFTDGYASFPETPPNVPVLWAITSNVTPPWGEVIRLKCGA